MAGRSASQRHARRALPWVAGVLVVCAVVAFAFVFPAVRSRNDRYRVGVKSVERVDAADQADFEVAESEHPVFSGYVDDEDMITREDARIYAGIVSDQANALLAQKSGKLKDYNMLTNWMVPYSSVNRIPDLKNMTVEEISPIKIAMYYNGELWLLDLGELADLETFNPATGTLTFRFPYSVMAFALFEPKRVV